MIVGKNIHKYFGDIQVLKGLDLHIKRGEIVAIVGPSGAGKTTLLQILGTLDKPLKEKDYELSINNISLKNLSDKELSEFRNNHIGFIFQTFHLLPKLDAIGNVKLPLRFSDVSEEEANERAHELLDKVGLGHRKTHKPFEMSGGQRQRVAIARALINRPTVVLADEPTGNLDSKTSVEIMRLLTDLHQQGQTIVMVTHEDDIATYAQRVITMRDGQVLQDTGVSQKLPNAAQG